MTEPEIRAVLADAMGAENHRREMASASPGLGSLMDLPQVPYGTAVGKAGLDLPAVGAGLAAVPYAPQSKSYGPDVPRYADPVVGGAGYGPGDVQTALRALGERVFAAQDAPGRSVVTVLSPDVAPHRSLLGRLFGRLRGRSS